MMTCTLHPEPKPEPKPNQVLPPSSWLRRNIAMHQAAGLDLTDGATVFEKLLLPRPIPRSKPSCS